MSVLPSEDRLAYESARLESMRTGRELASVLDDRALLLTTARRDQMWQASILLLAEDLRLMKPESLLLWHFGGTGPRTAAEMYEAMQAWLAMASSKLSQDLEAQHAFVSALREENTRRQGKARS